MTDLELGQCLLCQIQITGATYERGRTSELDWQPRPATATFEPCGHQVEGPAAWYWRNGITPRD